MQEKPDLSKMEIFLEGCQGEHEQAEWQRAETIQCRRRPQGSAQAVLALAADVAAKPVTSLSSPVSVTVQKRVIKPWAANNRVGHGKERRVLEKGK